MGAWPVYYVWPMPSRFIFESPDNWRNTHKADWRWPIIILLIGRDVQSRGQRALTAEVFWILLIGSRHRNAHWDLWNRTIARKCNTRCHFRNILQLRQSIPLEWRKSIQRCVSQERLLFMMKVQATGLDATASRVKWPAHFMSHWYGTLFTEW